MRKFLFVTITILTTFTILLSGSLKAQVDSMSLENFKTQGDKRYWEIKVKCVGDTQTKKMQRVVNGKKTWCSFDDQDFCNENKFTLSQELCGSNEAIADSSQQVVQEGSIVAITEPIPATSEDIDGSQDLAEKVWTEAEAEQNDKEALKTKLMREQVQIEEQRILLEQKRLELVRRELALKQQQAN